MDFLILLKAALFGVVQGITEWLPISSTGHMILLNELVKLGLDDKFWNMFLVVIQFGSILAVVVLFWNKLFPFTCKGGSFVKPGAIAMWLKIIVACIPAGIVGLLWDDQIDALFYNWPTVASALIVFGVLFLLVERRNASRTPTVTDIADITYRDALLIGLFQLVAAVFPGTSRSGATILGALLLGLSRTTAAEFTFFLAVPVMFGASLVKIVKFGFAFSRLELSVLLVGMVVAFGVSILAIRFLLGYIKKHDFKAFGWYRIALGALVLAYFTLV